MRRAASGFVLTIVFAIGLAVGAGVVAAVGAAAQGNAEPPQMKTFASSADITALVAKAKSDIKEGQPTTIERILALAPYNVNLEYRRGVTNFAVHEREAELFYVLDGSGTMVTGGTLVNEKRTNEANLSGTGIEGGNPREVAKGDVIFVPQNTPHGFSEINGTLILMSMHVPRTAGATH